MKKKKQTWLKHEKHHENMTTNLKLRLLTTATKQNRMMIAWLSLEGGGSIFNLVQCMVVWPEEPNRGVCKGGPHLNLGPLVNLFLFYMYVVLFYFILLFFSLLYLYKMKPCKLHCGIIGGEVGGVHSTKAYLGRVTEMGPKISLLV